ncbi:hypothetical protein [Mycobacterium asiaticum]|uniref:Serine/arginine repetitive matrix protein 2 n=1 Tax=Mycobacterium asiaticum TaxID=1790 RepID=A0A1A3BZU2_MYCAS|nr:hypothetical protein [Mycobacterium asiaticum]OBI79903.1 hypothetical protein A9X01_25625 [Mycobacterium asiaticum]
MSFQQHPAGELGAAGNPANPAGPAHPNNPPGYPTPGWSAPPGGPPGYSWTPPAGSPPSGFPSPQGAGEPRPQKFWYAIGGILVALGLLGGAIGAISTFAGEVGDLTARAPTSEHTFGNKGSTNVSIDAGASKTIYVTQRTPRSNITCTARGTAGQRKPTLTEYQSNVTINQWRALFTLTVQDGGDYSVSCSGPSEAGFGVGDHVTGGQVAHSVAGVFVAAGIGGVFVIAGVIVLAVTAFRRSRSARQPVFPPQPQQWPGPQ